MFTEEIGLQNLKISVVVPIYMIENYLPQCVDSILSQTYKNLEIILVDDGSRDACSEICDKYTVLDKRVQVIHKKNGGLTSTRKAGVRAATGDYVLYVDGDDWIEANYVENMVAPLGRFHSDMVGNLSLYMDYSDGRSLERSTPMKVGVYKKEDFVAKVYPFFIYEEKFYDTSLPANVYSYLYRREFLRVIQDQIDDEISTGEDLALTFRALLQADSIIIVNKQGYHYRQRADSMIHHAKDDCFGRIKNLYNNLRKAVVETAPSERAEAMQRKIPLAIFFILWLGSTERMVGISNEFLFPYQQVKNGSRIFVYGMGAVGRGIINALHTSSRFDLVGCSDQGWQQCANGLLFDDGTVCKVFSPEAIKNISFDWLIIGVSRVKFRQEIYTELLRQGVPEGKIAGIDQSLLTENNLPF